jgi:hypothetical protein
MASVTWGIVRGGVIVPNVPLPEGAQVEIHVHGVPAEMPPDVQADFAGWDRASAEALDLVERLSQEGGEDATR